jgi:hypothetical protein
MYEDFMKDQESFNQSSIYRFLVPTSQSNYLRVPSRRLIPSLTTDSETTKSFHDHLIPTPLDSSHHSFFIYGRCPSNEAQMRIIEQDKNKPSSFPSTLSNELELIDSKNVFSQMSSRLEVLKNSSSPTGLSSNQVNPSQYKGSFLNKQDLPSVSDEKMKNGLFVRKIDRFEILNEKGIFD